MYSCDTFKKLLVAGANVGYAFFFGPHHICTFVVAVNVFSEELDKIPIQWMPACIRLQIEAMKNYLGDKGLKQKISVMHHLYALLTMLYATHRNPEEKWTHLAIAAGQGIVHIFFKPI